jgi:hypothetical protein
MSALLFIGFFLFELGAGFYDVAWSGSTTVAETQEDGLVQTMDGGWPPPPSEP